jgi:hypothetical protein
VRQKHRSNDEKSPKLRKIAQTTKNRPNDEKSPKRRKIAQSAKNRPNDEKSPNLVALTVNVEFMLIVRPFEN